MKSAKTGNRKKGGNVGESLKGLVTYQKGCIYTNKDRSARGRARWKITGLYNVIVHPHGYIFGHQLD